MVFSGEDVFTTEAGRPVKTAGGQKTPTALHLPPSREGRDTAEEAATGPSTHLRIELEKH